MGIIIQISDFAGFQLAAKSPQINVQLQSIIDRWEQWYIQKILGISVTTAYPVSLAASFIADCAANPFKGPTGTLNLAIYNPIAFQTGLIEFISRGMKDTLLSMVYYRYIFDKIASDNQANVSGTNTDTATNLTPKGAAQFGATRYNDAIISIEAIQYYISAGDGTGLAGHGGAIDYPSYMNPGKITPKYFL